MTWSTMPLNMGRWEYYSEWMSYLKLYCQNY